MVLRLTITYVVRDNSQILKKHWDAIKLNIKHLIGTLYREFSRESIHWGIFWWWLCSMCTQSKIHYYVCLHFWWINYFLKSFVGDCTLVSNTKLKHGFSSKSCIKSDWITSMVEELFTLIVNHFLGNKEHGVLCKDGHIYVS